MLPVVGMEKPYRYRNKAQFPVGNDKELGKCTYVSYYGLDGAKKELDKIIKEAIDELEIYGEKAEFLRQLAVYIRDRNK